MRAIPAPAALGVFACAAMAFSFITCELLPIGLLPRIATSLDVSLPAAGLLLSAYALVVTLVGPPLTASLGTVPRKRLMLILAAALAASAALSALAASYALLMVARTLNAVAHGVFWSITASTAASLVVAEKRGFALALVFAGSSIAFVLGVPAATFVGERFGWHAAFWCVVGVALVAFATLALGPEMPAARPSALADVRRLLASGSFVRLLLTTVLVVVGNYTAFSYFTPLLHGAAQQIAGGVPTLLLLYGVAGFASTFVFGWAAHRSDVVALVVATALVAVALAALAAARSAGAGAVLVSVAGVMLWGFGMGGAAVSFQARVLSAQPDEPDVASSLNSSAFNFGIGTGAVVGGVVLRFAGLDALPAVAACFVVSAVALQLVPLLRERDA